MGKAVTTGSIRAAAEAISEVSKLIVKYVGEDNLSGTHIGLPNAQDWVLVEQLSQLCFLRIGADSWQNFLSAIRQIDLTLTNRAGSMDVYVEKKRLEYVAAQMMRDSGEPGSV
jgi:hypothetical protein